MKSVMIARILNIELGELLPGDVSVGWYLVTKPILIEYNTNVSITFFVL